MHQACRQNEQNEKSHLAQVRSKSVFLASIPCGIFGPGTGCWQVGQWIMVTSGASCISIRQSAVLPSSPDSATALSVNHLQRPISLSETTFWISRSVALCLSFMHPGSGHPIRMILPSSMRIRQYPSRHSWQKTCEDEQDNKMHLAPLTDVRQSRHAYEVRSKDWIFWPLSQSCIERAISCQAFGNLVVLIR